MDEEAGMYNRARSLPIFSSNSFNFLVKQESRSTGENEDGGGVVGDLKW